VRHRRAARLADATAHFIDELLNFTPDPDAPYVGRNAFAHKGGMHVAGVTPTRRRSSTSTRPRSATARELLISELSGKGTVQAAPRTPASTR
jgi:2-isopropylmalate synthase